MQITEVTAAMKPGADAVLDKNLTLDEAIIAFRRVVVGAAVEQNEGVYLRAAQKLRCSAAWISEVMSGGLVRKPRGPKRKPEQKTA